MKLNASPLILSVLLALPSPSSAVSQSRDGGSGGVALRASVPMGSIVNTGDRIAFDYESRDDAAILVFDIDTRGYVHLLAPGGNIEVSRAMTTYSLPEPGRDLVVDSQTGVEFVFALAVDDPSVIDLAEVDHMRAADTPGADPYRVSGDPFVAANMIAGELVRGVSRRGVTFGYTMFYVNQRVDHPCYLCGDCDGGTPDPTCDGYRIVQAFDRRSPLTYPLRRGYQTVEVTADATDQPDSGGIFSSGDDSDVMVNFYPYGSQVRYADPVPAYYYGGLYDPFYWYYPYYPYCNSGWSLSIGWGWGWGWGWGCGGYYCSGWYAPPCGGYYPSYPSGGYTYPDRFKAKYKNEAGASNMLVRDRASAAQRDSDLRLAQADVRRSMKTIDTQSIGRQTRFGTANLFASSRSKPTAPRLPTKVSGVARTPGHAKAVPGRTSTGHVRGSVPSSGSRGYVPRAKSGSPSYRGGSAKSGGSPYYRSPARSGGTSKARGYSGAAFKGFPQYSSHGSSRSPFSGFGRQGGTSGYHAPSMRGGFAGSSGWHGGGGGFKSAPHAAHGRR